MTTAQLVTLSLVIFFGLSFALALLWGKFAHAGAGQEAPPPAPVDKLADRLDALIVERKCAELAWMIELQERIAEHRKKLADMALFPNTHEVIKLRTLIRVQIDGDERALELLRIRGQRETAANLWEGRM